MQSGHQEIADDYSCLKCGQMWKAMMMMKNSGIREKLFTVSKCIFPNISSFTKGQQRKCGTSESSFETSTSALPQNLPNWCSDDKTFQNIYVYIQGVPRLTIYLKEEIHFFAHPALHFNVDCVILFHTANMTVPPLAQQKQNGPIKRMSMHL